MGNDTCLKATTPLEKCFGLIGDRDEQVGFYLTLLFAVMATATATAELPETILESAGKNRNEIEKATAAASDSERPGLEFLLQNMPARPPIAFR